MDVVLPLPAAGEMGDQDVKSFLDQKLLENLNLSFQVQAKLGMTFDVGESLFTEPSR